MNLLTGASLLSLVKSIHHSLRMICELYKELHYKFI